MILPSISVGNMSSCIDGIDDCLDFKISIIETDTTSSASIYIRLISIKGKI